MKEPIEKYKLELKNIQEESSGFKKISCPSCHQETLAADINIQDKIAKCSTCNVVFSIEPKISNLLSKSTIKQEVIRPEGIDIFYFQNDLDITIQQPPLAFDIVAGILLPFAAIIATLIYFFPEGRDPSILFPIILWLFSLYPLVNLFNRKKHKMHIVVEDETLSLYRKPRRFIKDKHIDTREIDQLYVKKNQHIYSIFMIVNGVNGQKHISLINNLDSLSKARFLEQEIEKHLNIEDRKIPDEAG